MSGPRVLIVEDEMIIAWDLRMTLEGLGCEIVAITATADQAVEKAKEEDPDLILMDIVLKGRRTGMDAAAEICLFSRAAIIYLTGNTDLINETVMKATRAQGILGKPPSIAQLTGILKACGDNK